MRAMRIVAAVMVAAIVGVACDRSHDGLLDEEFETQNVDIVTYTGVDDDNCAKFRLDGRDDEPAVMLFTSVKAPANVKENSRLLLTYSIKHRGADGSYWDVDAIGYSRIISDSLRVNSNPIDSYSMHPVKLSSTWRTGEFVNMHGQVEVTSRTRQLFMMVDKTTRGRDTVDAYLVHNLMGAPADSIFYWRDFYFSVNVGVLRSTKDPCRVLRLHLNDANRGGMEIREFKFSKP